MIEMKCNEIRITTFWLILTREGQLTKMRLRFGNGTLKSFYKRKGNYDMKFQIEMRSIQMLTSSSSLDVPDEEEDIISADGWMGVEDWDRIPSSDRAFENSLWRRAT